MSQIEIVVTQFLANHISFFNSDLGDIDLGEAAAWTHQGSVHILQVRKVGREDDVDTLVGCDALGFVEQTRHLAVVVQTRHEQCIQIFQQQNVRAWVIIFQCLLEHITISVDQCRGRSNLQIGRGHHYGIQCLSHGTHESRLAGASVTIQQQNRCTATMIGVCKLLDGHIPFTCERRIERRKCCFSASFQNFFTKGNEWSVTVVHDVLGSLERRQEYTALGPLVHCSQYIHAQINKTDVSDFQIVAGSLVIGGHEHDCADRALLIIVLDQEFVVGQLGLDKHIGWAVIDKVNYETQLLISQGFTDLFQVLGFQELLVTEDKATFSMGELRCVCVRLNGIDHT